MSFTAKVDLWFLLLFYGLGLGMLFVAPLIRKRAKQSWAALLLVVLGLLFVGVAWRASSVEYVISHDGYLDATGWPYHGRIAHIGDIQRIEPSNDPRASHAASLDRLRIDFTRPDGWRGTIFIAVEDKDGFLEALSTKDSALVRPEPGALRLERAAVR